jgi:ribonuclease G
MKGSVILIQPASEGREIAALVRDGRLEDLFFDLPETDPAPRLGAICRAIPDRPAKGLGGVMVRLPDGQMGFLRETAGIAPGRPLLVQVSSLSEPGKAVPVTVRLIFKSRHVIITPGAPGLNMSRRIHDEELRAGLQSMAGAAMEGADQDMGLILRSSCVHADAEEIVADIARMRDLAETVLAGTQGREPDLLVDGEGAASRAWTDWAEAGAEEVIEGEHAFDRLGVWEMIDALRRSEADLQGGAWLSVEPTRALVAVDVNSGGDFAPAATLRANIAAARELPRQLRLRGLGGKVVVDFAALPKKDRAQIEKSLGAALRSDPVETSIAGWTPLGNLELNRKRERRPLSDLKP